MGGGGSGGGGGGLHSPGITSFATGTVSFGGSSTAVVPASADSCGLGPLLCLPWQSTGVSMGYSPAAVSTSPATRSCFPVSLPSPPVHSSRCSRPLAWPSRWPWLSSGCPFDRALGVRSLGPKKIETEPSWLSFGARRSKRQRGVGWGSAGVR